MKDEWGFKGRYTGEVRTLPDGKQQQAHGVGYWERIGDKDICMGTWNEGKRHGKCRFVN